jgi:dihydrofolate reductase
MEISIIVAVANNGGIGLDNKLLWHLSDDLKMFKKLTSNHFILMGRKTFDSIGKPLPNRQNLVLTSNPISLPSGCIPILSLEAGIELAKEAGEKELFVIGGANIYKQAMPFVNKIYLSRVNVSLQADTFFEPIIETDWLLLEKIPFLKSEKNEFDFDFLVYKRK